MVQNNPDQFTALRKEDALLISTNHLLLSIYQPLTGISPLAISDEYYQKQIPLQLCMQIKLQILTFMSMGLSTDKLICYTLFLNTAICKRYHFLTEVLMKALMLKEFALLTN